MSIKVLLSSKCRSKRKIGSLEEDAAVSCHRQQSVSAV